MVTESISSSRSGCTTEPNKQPRDSSAARSVFLASIGPLESNALPYRWGKCVAVEETTNCSFKVSAQLSTFELLRFSRLGEALR